MNNITTITDNSERILNTKTLEGQWKSINWKVAQDSVNRLQVRIAKATKNKKWSKVKRLQYLLTHSYYAKAVAVKKVTTNKGKETSGIDGQVWATPASKARAVNSITDIKYKAKPVKRVYIEKKSKSQKRPLGIPSMYDRAIQALYTLALEPIAEVNADRSSFGFRPGRSAQDAQAEIFGVLSQKRSAQYVLEGDIRSCFDKINHNWILDNVPIDKKILRQFLKAGYMYKGELFPTDEGVVQGSIIGPLLANITLDGMQSVLFSYFRKTKRQADAHKINFIRYADDFIVTAATKEIAEEAKGLIKNFLNARGLELSEEKTKITEIHEGFHFLSWNFRKYKNDALIITPSKKSVRSLFDKIKEIIHKGVAAKQNELITKLNPILRGWANYHQSACSKSVFQRVSNQTF